MPNKAYSPHFNHVLLLLIRFQYNRERDQTEMSYISVYEPQFESSSAIFNAADGKETSREEGFPEKGFLGSPQCGYKNKTIKQSAEIAVMVDHEEDQARIQKQCCGR